MNFFKNITILLLLVSLASVLTVSAADTPADYNATKTKVIEVQNENSNLPTNLPVDERK
jgi:hypothetical protein